MTSSFRRKLFLFFVFIFVFLSISIVYYARGYRFDTQLFTLTQTGSVYIESSQRSVSIYLNDKPYKDKSNLLKRGTLISSILPKKYTVRIEKDGFVPYKKHMSVQPLRVSRLFHILLVPQKISPLSSVPASTSNKKAVRIVDANNSGYVLMIDSAGQYSLIHTRTPSQSFSLNQRLASLTKNTYESYALAQKENTALYAKQGNTIFEIQLSSETIRPLLQIQASSTKQFLKGNFVYGVASSSIALYDIRSPSAVRTLVPPFSPRDVILYEGTENNHAFLLSNGDVWLFQNSLFEKIAHDAKFIQFSPDGYKLLFQDTNGSVFIHILRDEYEALDMPRNTTYRLELIDVRAIQDITWHSDSYHLFIGYRDRISLAEITRTEPNNQTPVWNGVYDSYFYALDTQTFFVLRDNSLTSFDFSTF